MKIITENPIGQFFAKEDLFKNDFVKIVGKKYIKRIKKSNEKVLGMIKKNYSKGQEVDKVYSGELKFKTHFNF